MKRLTHFCTDRRGTTSMEYAMIGALISIIAIGAMTQIGNSVTTMLASVQAGFR